MTEYDPHSLLFLSCDIVGSTRYKQQREFWQDTFLSFYREFPQILGEITIEEGYEPGFNLWKPVGDELIFTTRVTSEMDVFAATRIWLRAMGHYETSVLEQVSLSTKGGAFIATFPGPDSRSSIPRNPTIETSDKGVVELNDEALANPSPDYLYDFFGPSIDTGFRVLSACSQRYFTLSVEVAWAIAQCGVDAGVDDSQYPLTDLILLDTREFKGVWAGREYPVFVLDRQVKDLVNVALSKLQGRETSPIDVANLCRECSAKPDWPSALYLPNSQHSLFRIPPADSLDRLRSNSMEGAETLPANEAGADALESDAPLSANPSGEKSLTDTDDPVR